MLHNALCITTPDFACLEPLNVFHREAEPWENHHDASLENRHILFRRAFTLESVPERQFCI